MNGSDGDLTPEQEKEVTFIRKAAEGLSALVNDLLDLAKVEAGKAVVRPEAFEVADLFEGLRGTTRPLLAQGSVTLIFEEPVAMPTLHTDEGKVAQILRNFLSNAVKFTERGEIRVAATAGPGDTVIFSVTDTGIGIAPEDQRRIFEEFSQVEGPLQKRVKGTGLGLPLSRKLAELLGGNVSVRSEPGVGSTFFAVIPRSYRPVDDADDTPESRWRPDPHRSPLLVVEDDPVDLLLYEKDLEGSGFQVLPARTLDEARRVLRRVRPVAVLLDILLEVESGWTLLTEMKGQAATRDIPILVLTVVDGKERALALGADDFCLKPIDQDWLLEPAGRAGAERTARDGPDHRRRGGDRHVLKELLSAQGRFAIVEAANGEEGLRRAREDRPDVIFLDLVMPDMTGFEVLDRLKSDTATNGIPVIINTSAILSEEERRRLTAGTAAILAKSAATAEEAFVTIREALIHAGLNLTPADMERDMAGRLPDHRPDRRRRRGQAVRHRQDPPQGGVSDPRRRDRGRRPAARRRPADLIILDVKLPDVSGFEVCRRIKEDPATAAIPVLHISTTFVDIEDKIHGLEGGADGYLTDVLEPLELIATVKALLRARKAEEAAQISTRQWQVTFDAVNDGVILLDRDGRAVQINPAMEGILGKPWNELSGQEIHDLLSIAPVPEDSPFLRMLESGQREVVELTLGDRWLHVTVDPIRDADGDVKGGLCIVSDITDRRRLEEELRRRAEELAAADRRKDEFLAMLAHELRNPLAPISNALEAIRLARSNAAATEEALKIAERQVEHMARLLDDLLDVSRFTQGKIQLRKVPVDLTTILPHAVETSRPLIEASGHELLTSFPAEPVWLDGDPTRLAQVVANLLNNAAKYTDRGGRITLAADREGDEAVVRVRDTGIGLSAEMLPRVFDLFAQADRSLDRSQGGLGIGLTLVRSLVELHDGSVSVESRGPGQGSEFIVRLPASSRTHSTPDPNENASSAEESAHPLPAGSRGRRQSGFGAEPRPSAEALGLRGTRRPRRPRGDRGGFCRPVRRDPPGHRPPGHGRLPGCRTAPRPVRIGPAGAGRPDGIRPGGGPGTLSKRRIRRPPRQAREPRQAARNAFRLLRGTMQGGPLGLAAVLVFEASI